MPRLLNNLQAKIKHCPVKTQKSENCKTQMSYQTTFAIAGENQTFQNMENGCHCLSWRNSKLKIAKTKKLENNKSRMSYQGTFAKAGENLPLLQLEQTSYYMTGETPEKSKAKL
ncbi:hypothetical protein [Desulforegula conservatrix]|uniref:hypothetical protein n=1 Tax=Desulforegula conservatrix TaxID=153026 RepID=UPI000484C5AB|nr:hypothetical protein [Desulforegula conservatrix]